MAKTTTKTTPVPPGRTIDQILKDKAATEKPKNKGGRPKGSKNKPKPPADPQLRIPDEQTAPPPPSLDDDIARLKAEHPPEQEPTAPDATTSDTDQKEPAGPMVPGPASNAAPVIERFTISGTLGLIVIDSLIPFAMAWLLNRFGGHNVEKADLQLTPAEIEQLKPLADEVAKRINADPVLLLSIALLGCYASKIPSKKPVK